MQPSDEVGGQPAPGAPAPLNAAAMPPARAGRRGLARPEAQEARAGAAHSARAAEAGPDDLDDSFEDDVKKMTDATLIGVWGNPYDARLP